jgi:hypothetical protein
VAASLLGTALGVEAPLGVAKTLVVVTDRAECDWETLWEDSAHSEKIKPPSEPGGSDGEGAAPLHGFEPAEGWPGGSLVACQSRLSRAFHAAACRGRGEGGQCLLTDTNSCL